MVNFTFNLFNKLPFASKAYESVANFVNKNLLDRKLFNPAFLAIAFNAVDSFWLKHRSTDWYSRSELRVITGSILESISDNNLSEKEVEKLTRYILSKWDPRVAEQKQQSQELLSKVEKNAEVTVKAYRKIGKKVKPSKLVAEAAKVSKAKASDDGIIESLTRIFR
jgi:hypothetical protein